GSRGAAGLRGNRPAAGGTRSRGRRAGIVRPSALPGVRQSIATAARLPGGGPAGAAIGIRAVRRGGERGDAVRLRGGGERPRRRRVRPDRNGPNRVRLSLRRHGGPCQVSPRDAAGKGTLAGDGTSRAAAHGNMVSAGKYRRSVGSHRDRVWPTMKVLIYTRGFAPQIGGTETHVMLLAQGLAEFAAAPGKAIDVTVATRTPAGAAEDAALPFRVVRRPGPAALLRLIREADIVHLAGPAFLPLLLGLVMRKRVALEHHSFQVACPNGLLVYEPTATPCPGHFMARRHREC